MKPSKNPFRGAGRRSKGKGYLAKQARPGPPPNPLWLFGGTIIASPAAITYLLPYSAKMDSFIKWMDSCPLILKIIFALPALDIVWGIYRIIKAVNAKDTLAIVIDILLLVFGSWTVMWLVDIITICLKGSVLDFIGLAK